jgi:hypothetical protein
MERLGIKQQVVEALTWAYRGFSSRRPSAIYQRHTYEEEKRDAIEKWAEHIACLLRRVK